MPKFFDGAFGTYYYSLTNDDAPCERANFTDPKTVLSIHKEYIKAGVDYIKTNTFHTTDTILLTQGYGIAMQAVEGTDVCVFADIGPITCDAPSELELQYRKVAETFVALGATNFLFETLFEYDVIVPAIHLIKERIPHATIMVSFAVSQDGYTRKGLYYKTLLQNAAANPFVSIVGLNCACGPTHLLNLTKALDPATLSKPFAAMPNSGYPSSLNGRMVFEDNAGYFARKINELFYEGASIFGGCCGTTPKHIQLAVKGIHVKYIPVANQPKSISPTLDKSIKRLALKPIFVELDPPLSSDCTYLLDAVDKLKACRVEAITFADSPLAKARADSIMTAAKIKREKSIDVLPHLTCRDKNHIAMKASLLGASFEGIDRILAVTGDPVVFDAYKKSGVFNFNSIGLISFIKSLNKDLFVDKPFSIGGAMNINARNFQKELERCKRKVDNGASFLLSQPMFTATAIENFIQAKRVLMQESDCKLYAGVLPVASYKNAIFLNNEVSGIEIPQDVIDRLIDKPVEKVYDVSIQFSKGIIEKVYDYADGFYIMTPLKKVDLICSLISSCFEI
ncbi:bifunctional homocysteine S-methyltransferase/methylenetetrahydrofolate reductase [Lachnospiraceae bacterium ZAX-1]